MDISVVQIVLLFIVSTIIGIGSIFDEFQTHRPLIACTLVGAVLGDIHTGIVVGGVLELLALGWANIGAAVAPDSALASVISTILVIVAKQERDVAISLAIPIAAAGQVLSIFIRAICVSFQHGADKAAETGEWKYISLYHYLGIFLYSLRISIIAVLVALTAGTSVVQDLINGIPDVITQGLSIAGGFIVVVGYAMIINMMRAGHLMPFFFLGFTTAAFTNFNLIGMGVVGLCLAIVYIQIHPKYQKGSVANANTQASSQANLADNRLDD
ncbi:PTS mannose/fructose/sorbose transporter subunit IIC [Psittacicella melopsittaci]|uniref:PTS mannose/fructose/sorbose transporter subunit IIC n=1 Tax=Psittacicella melopsittaci TaxID=2028576 RepID=A0A3A1Y6C2_9GAMM|nr:PTS mannose/fructose/sorbose transporter subunit IIC [Psittacicella melopsittaci]RIY32846.1 PTS mannose/fructose/sorbose transporter subunit IIC [Psittacicella melopsittaci]